MGIGEQCEDCKLNKIKEYYERRIEWLEEYYEFDYKYNSIHDMSDNPSKLVAYGKYLMFRSSVFKINKLMENV